MIKTHQDYQNICLKYRHRLMNLITTDLPFIEKIVLQAYHNSFAKVTTVYSNYSN